MSKIMILGAGVYQTPLIKKARQLGHEVIVVSIPGNYPGFEYADKIYYEDTRDFDSILRIAKNESIDGITTLGTDVAVRTIGHICEHLDLIGIKEKTGIVSTNKKYMKEAFFEHGIRTSDFRTVYCIEDAYSAFEELKKPIVMKVVDRSGSKGIVKVDTKDKIDSAYSYCMENTDKNYIIAEEFVEGLKIGAEAAVINKEIAFVLPNGDILHRQGKIDIPIGHFSPCQIDKSIENQIEVQIEKIVDAMNLDNCGINLDLIIKNREVFVIEAAARAGGSNIADLVSSAYGVDYYKFIIDLALGEAKPIADKPKFAAASQVLYSEKDGTLKSFNLNSHDERIVEFQMDYKPGDHIRRFRTGPDRIGHIVVKCDLGENPLKLMNDIVSNIEIIVE